MTDVYIRDVPDDVMAAIDRRADRLGLSRSAYLHRLLSQEARSDETAVTEPQLQRFSHSARDLADPDVMNQAWL